MRVECLPDFVIVPVSTQVYVCMCLCKAISVQCNVSGVNAESAFIIPAQGFAVRSECIEMSGCLAVLWPQLQCSSNKYTIHSHRKVHINMCLWNVHHLVRHIIRSYFLKSKWQKEKQKKNNTENPPGNTEISGRRAKPYTQTHTNERRNPFRKFTVPLNYVATIQCVMWCVFVCSFLSSSFFSYALFPRILFSSGAPNLGGTLSATHSIISNTSFRRRNKNSSLLSALFCGCCCCCGCGFGSQEQVHRTHWHI